MRKIFFLLAALFLAFALVLVYVRLNYHPKLMTQAEKEAALTKLLGRKVNLSTNATQKTYLSFNGKYVSFVYPSDAKPFDEQNKPEGAYFDKTALESFTFGLENPFLWVSVSVLPTPSGVGSLEDYSGIKVRQLDPSNYQQSKIVLNGQQGLQYEKPETASGTSKEAFFYLNNKIYMIHVEGSKKDDVVSLFGKIISSFKFL